MRTTYDNLEGEHKEIYDQLLSEMKKNYDRQQAIEARLYEAKEAGVQLDRTMVNFLNDRIPMGTILVINVSGGGLPLMFMIVRIEYATNAMTAKVVTTKDPAMYLPVEMLMSAQIYKPST
jgi:hypothetical protein